MGPPEDDIPELEDALDVYDSSGRGASRVIGLLRTEVVELREDVAALQERLRRLLEALERYGRHEWGCYALSGRPDDGCSCGYRAALDGDDR